MRVADLSSALMNGGKFPRDRLPAVVDRAIDTKLQMYLVLEVTAPRINAVYHERVNRDRSASELASVKLAVVSIHQDLILKSRVLWERIMGLVYCLETGEPDIPRTNKRSAKATFFNMCEQTPWWKWLSAYKPMISSYDDRFRTPEAHKRSPLRGLLVRGDSLVEQTNEIIEPLNAAMNQVWENIVSIAAGGGVRSLGMVHGSGNLVVNPFDKCGLAARRVSPFWSRVESPGVTAGFAYAVAGSTATRRKRVLSSRVCGPGTPARHAKVVVGHTPPAQGVTGSPPGRPRGSG